MKKQIDDSAQTVPDPPETEPPGNPPADADAVETLRRLQSENAQLKDAARLGAASELIQTALTAEGARSPGLLFESARGDLQFDADGTLVNAAAIVERLKTKFPEQFGYDRPAASIDGGAGRIAAPALTKDALARMSPAEIARLDWADVRQVLANS